MTSGTDSWYIHLANVGPELAVRTLLEHAARMRASDLFFLSCDGAVEVAVRHHGLMRPLTKLEAEYGRHCMAHIKVVAGMDVVEHRRPQDGHWLFEHGAFLIDVRISTLPTLHGEDVTLRLFDHAVVRLELGALGMLPQQHLELQRWLSNPGGLILVTGPTGVGKTTTLYSCLKYLNNGERKINTIEDPIEYSLAGIRQTQVQPKLELNFAELLRGVLRQSPDVLMVGEIRDPRTAETVVRAANSGHLVLATLHAPLSAGAIQSLLGLNVHAQLLASSLRGVVAQRLVRTLCPHCKVGCDMSMTPDTFEEIEPWLADGEAATPCAARGCPKCFQTGYAARTGIFELLPSSKQIRQLIVQQQSSGALHRQAVADGALELRQAGLLCVARGLSTAEELLRAVPSEYLNVEM